MDQPIPFEGDSQQAWHEQIFVAEQYFSAFSQYRDKPMSLVIKANESTSYDPAPAGAHVARCYRILDLGTQKTTFKGDEKFVHQIMLTWELPTALMSEGSNAGKPFSISQRFTASLGEKSKLRKILENWRGKKFSPQELEGFDLQNILGKPCMLNIVHAENGGKTYANIEAVMQLPAGMVVPAQVNPSVFFSLSTFDQSIYDTLPKRLQETIALSPEYQSTAAGGARVVKQESEALAMPDDDIPF